MIMFKRKNQNSKSGRFTYLLVWGIFTTFALCAVHGQTNEQAVLKIRDYASRQFYDREEITCVLNHPTEAAVALKPLLASEDTRLRKTSSKGSIKGAKGVNS
jgi:hypothetical protein